MCERTRNPRSRVLETFAQVPTAGCMPKWSKDSSVSSPLLALSGNEVHVLRKQLTVTAYLFLRISKDPFLSGPKPHLSLTFQLLTSKPISLEFHGHSAFPGFPAFDVLKTATWASSGGPYSCDSDLQNVPSRECTLQFPTETPATSVQSLDEDSKLGYKTLLFIVIFRERILSLLPVCVQKRKRCCISQAFLFTVLRQY